MTPPTHEEFAREVAKHLPATVEVEVTEWAGCDEPWVDPVYVTALDQEDEEVEYYDAICDLASAPLDEQVAFVVEQLTHG